MTKRQSSHTSHQIKACLFPASPDFISDSLDVSLSSAHTAARCCGFCLECVGSGNEAYTEHWLWYRLLQITLNTYNRLCMFDGKDVKPPPELLNLTHTEQCKGVSSAL
ncbi:hypothetical protein WMY93_033470 [Mugilogobius chulae]|uniref:Uncharacterized protein n=1 Tax=Mugilogobius chulae TaxID=88201 RepID=A0AAW0MIN4_9GOBI